MTEHERLFSASSSSRRAHPRASKSCAWPGGSSRSSRRRSSRSRSARAARRARARWRRCWRSAARACAAAPHISCVGSTREEHRARCSRSIARTASAIWWRCAATCRRARRRRRVPLRERARRIHPRGDRRLVPHRSRRVSGISPAGAHRRTTTSRTSSARSTPAPNSAITQYFFNADAYFRFVDDARALGVSVPIVPGIMPITSFSQLARFSDACGAEIPRWIRRKLEGYGDDTASIRAFGLDVVTRAVRPTCSTAARRGCTSTR